MPASSGYLLLWIDLPTTVLRKIKHAHSHSRIQKWRTKEMDVRAWRRQGNRISDRTKKKWRTSIYANPTPDQGERGKQNMYRSWVKIFVLGDRRHQTMTIVLLLSAYWSRVEGYLFCVIYSIEHCSFRFFEAC